MPLNFSAGFLPLMAHPGEQHATMVTVPLSHLIERQIRLEPAEALAIAQVLASAPGVPAIENVEIDSDNNARVGKRMLQSPENGPNRPEKRRSRPPFGWDWAALADGRLPREQWQSRGHFGQRCARCLDISHDRANIGGWMSLLPPRRRPRAAN